VRAGRHQREHSSQHRSICFGPLERALAWLYLSAPGSVRIPPLGNISLGFLYQSGWALLVLTALVSYYVVIVTLRTVMRHDNKAADLKDDT